MSHDFAKSPLRCKVEFGRERIRAVASVISAAHWESRQWLRAHRAGDPDARERLVRLHLPLVDALARRYRGRGEALEDLQQVGAVALLAAIDRFDPGRGDDLVAFAVPTIDGELRRHLRDRVEAVRPPRRIHELRGALPALDRELVARLGRPPTDDERARAAGARREEVAAATAPLVVPLDEDRLADDADTLRGAEDRIALSRALRRLPARERRIVALRFAEGLSQAGIAARLGISQVHVSRLLRGALQTLRRELDDGNAR
jgi:RNA polymerase sigma-B factor